MEKARLLGASAVVAVLMFWWATSAADAALFSASLAPPAQTYASACPGPVNFNGTINGPKGFVVQYQFIGSGYPATTLQSATIPASGSLAVSETLVVDAGHQGVFQRQLYVKPPASSAPVYSTQVTYIVHCIGTSSTQQTKMKTLVQSLSSEVILAHTVAGLTNTTDPQTCGQHGGFAGLFCADALHSGDLILVWDWKGGNSYPDGYHVYEVDRGQRVHVTDQTNGQLTIAILGPPATGWAGRCYVVSAYKGAASSADSNTFCLGAAYAATSTLEVGPASLDERSKKYDYVGPLALANGGIEPLPGYAGFNVGYTHSDEGSGPTLDHHNAVFRGYALFDPAQIAGLRVFKATLIMTLDGDLKCFGAIGPATAAWIGNSNFVDGDFSYNITPTQDDILVTFDVTTIVRQWATGSPNYGFVLRGTNEDTGAEDNNRCLAYFGSPTLKVEHY